MLPEGSRIQGSLSCPDLSPWNVSSYCSPEPAFRQGHIIYEKSFTTSFCKGFNPLEALTDYRELVFQRVASSLAVNDIPVPSPDGTDIAPADIFN
jgi:hypothetical protein